MGYGKDAFVHIFVPARRGGPESGDASIRSSDYSNLRFRDALTVQSTLSHGFVRQICFFFQFVFLHSLGWRHPDIRSGPGVRPKKKKYIYKEKLTLNDETNQLRGGRYHHYPPHQKR